MIVFLYIGVPILYWIIGMWLHRRDFPKGHSTFGHIVAMDLVFTFIGIASATIVTWAVMWLVL